MTKCYAVILNAPLFDGGAVMPNHHFEIVKFCDTALYKRNQQEGKL